MKTPFIYKPSLQDFIAFCKDPSVLCSREMFVCITTYNLTVYVEVGAFVSINYHNIPVIYTQKIGNGFASSDEQDQLLKDRTFKEKSTIEGMLKSALFNVSNGRITDGEVNF